jgi:hypothetical protein
VAQDRPLVERYLRQPDGTWLLSEFSGLGSTLTLAGVEARFVLADLYVGITLSATPGH